MTTMAEQHGGMVALIPRDADLDALRVRGGESREELHLTLAYLGDDVDDWTADRRNHITAAALQVAQSVGGMVNARVMGHAVFNPDGHDDRQPCAVYLVGDSSMIAAMHELLKPSASHEQHAPFLPHITVAYCDVDGYGNKAWDNGSGAAEDGSAGYGEGNGHSGWLPDLDPESKSAASSSVDYGRRQGSPGSSNSGGGGREDRPSGSSGRGRSSQLPGRSVREPGAPGGADGGRALDRSRGRAEERSLLSAQGALRPDGFKGLGGMQRLSSISYGGLPEAESGARSIDSSATGPQERADACEIKNAGSTGQGSGKAARPSRLSVSKAFQRMTFTGPITFDRLRVALADQTYDFPLGMIDEKSIVSDYLVETRMDGTDDVVELKLMSADPRAATLREYWAHGKGRPQWNKWRELRRKLKKYVKNPNILDGLTSNIYRLAKGHNPPRGAKSAEAGFALSETELKAALALADPDAAFNPDDLADWLDEDDEGDEEFDENDPVQVYERAMINDIDWEIDSEGALVRSDEDDDIEEDEEIPMGPRPVDTGVSLWDLVDVD